MKTLPVEYRFRVIELIEDGYTTSEIAELLGTSGAWVRSIKALHKVGRPLEPKSRANQRKSLAEREGERIRVRIQPKKVRPRRRANAGRRRRGPLELVDRGADD